MKYNEKTADEILRRYKRDDRDFRGVTLKEGDLSKQRLAGVIFEGAQLLDCTFEKSILRRSNFKAASLRGTTFKGADLSKSNLTGADFRGATLRAVNLSGADLRWANLEGVNLSGSDISGANFEGANLKSANLKGANPGRLWWKAKLEEARLEGTILPDGTIYGQAAVSTVEE
jgi:uncharacterized protein YjbI with pentapeptide repeats